LNCLTIDFNNLQPSLLLQLVVLGVIITCYFIDRRVRRKELEDILTAKQSLFEKNKNN
jgi:uncharacterized membrane protein affecting hemolysin expression